MGEVEVPTADTVCYSFKQNEAVGTNGIFDTDGTIFFSSKPGIVNYPTLEITSKSLTLLKQIKDLLRRKYDITSHIRKSDKAYRIAIYGRKELTKWIKFINSSHKRKSRLLARAIRRS